MEPDKEAEQEGQEKPEKIVSNREFWIVSNIVFLSDTIQAAGEVALIGLVLNPLINFMAYIIIRYWFWIKGIRGMLIMAIVLIGTIAEFIPILDLLPIRTAVVMIAMYLANHPAATAGAANVAAKIAK